METRERFVLRITHCPYCEAGQESLETFEFGEFYCEACHRWFGYDEYAREAKSFEAEESKQKAEGVIASV